MNTAIAARVDGAVRPADAESFDGVLVVGGGYAGMQAAVAARDAGAAVLLVDPDEHFTFTTRLAAVAGGTAPRSAASAPYEDFGVDTRRDRLVSFEDGLVKLASGASVRASALVIAAGSVPLRPAVPGVEGASTLRTAAQALDLRTRLAAADHTIIVGAGATGVQLAGSLSACRPGTRVTLIDRDPLPIANLGERVGGRAARILRDRDVDLLLGRTVERVADDHVELDAGACIGGDVVVWAAGFDAAPDRVGTPPQRNGAIAVDRRAVVDGCERTFAVGDIADHRDDGDSLPMSAQIAVQAGRQVGERAAGVLRGEPPRPIRLHQRGWVIDLGGGRGVAQLGPIALAGRHLDRLPPLLHDAIDIKTLWELGGLRAAARHRPR